MAFFVILFQSIYKSLPLYQLYQSEEGRKGRRRKKRYDGKEKVTGFDFINSASG
jgi:hypothetical protein